MTLRELLASARNSRARPKRLGRGAAGGQRISPIGATSVTPGALFFCVPGFMRGRPRLRAGRRRARGGRARLRAPARARTCPSWSCRGRARRDGAARGGLPRRPDGRAARGRRHRHERQDDNGVPVARTILEAQGRRPGCSAPCTRSSAAGRGGRAHHPGGDRPSATFRRMLDAGDQACVMEVSSHALELHRADGIEFDCAVFTNLTQDHLDFHGSLEEYFAPKRRLFVPAHGTSRRAPLSSTSDDEWGARLAEELRGAGDAPVVTFGVDTEADFRATDVELDAAGARFDCHARSASRRRAAAAAGPLQRLQRARRDRRRARARRRAARRARRRSSRRSACPAASSRSTRARPSACSSTTPTRRTRWRTCWSRRASLLEQSGRGG